MSIGGALDYAALAQLHRPLDAAGLAACCRDLASQGLTPNDIGLALRVTPAEVRRLLAALPNEAAAIVAEAWQSPNADTGKERP